MKITFSIGQTRKIKGVSPDTPITIIQKHYEILLRKKTFVLSSICKEGIYIYIKYPKYLLI